MSVSQQIAELLTGMLTDGEAEICRNDLASRIGCSPSQINYVLASRFCPEQGYCVESRRGGGGYIRIRKISVQESLRGRYLMQLLSELPPAADEAALSRMIAGLENMKVISGEQRALLRAAVSDRALSPAPEQERDVLRISIFKHLLPVIAAGLKE